MADYIAYLHKEKGSDYGVSFPDFPGAVTAGRTLEEAKELAIEVLALHIQGMVEDGEAIPEPSTLDVLAGDPAIQGAVAFLVPSQTPEKVVRFNITARETQLAEINQLAREAGLNRSVYMVQASLGTAQTGIVPKEGQVRMGRTRIGNLAHAARARKGQTSAKRRSVA